MLHQIILKKLGNSYAQNENIGFGTTYFLIKVSLD